MRYKKKTLAQTTVEFALTLPVMLVIILGIMDLGRFLYYNSALTNAVREATRFGIVQQEFTNPILADIAQEVKDHAIGIKPDDITVTVVYDSEIGSITVNSTYAFSPATPIGVLILGSGNTIPINSEATMTVEY